MSKDPLDLHEEAANVIYRDSASREPATRDAAASAERVLYRHPVEGVLDRRLPEFGDVTGATIAQQQELRNTFIGIAKNTGLPDAVVMKIAEAHVDAELAMHRADDPDEHALTVDNHIKQSNAELREDFRLRYGAKDGEELLERVRKFVRAHEPLAEMLREHGLGSRPEIVDAIAAHVFSTGYR